jgi:adenine-specific DNA methylase
MSDKLGIGYMGSKRKFAGDIINFIKSRHPDITDFYDLFGGGGAISFTALTKRYNTHYNELNSHIFELVKYLQTHKKLEPKFYEWVTREEFFKQCARTDADFYSGFVMSCWSFGNKQSSYIYGADIEEIKRLAHEFVVYGCLNSMRLLEIDIPTLLDIKDVQQRRIVFCKHIDQVTK